MLDFVLVFLAVIGVFSLAERLLVSYLVKRQEEEEEEIVELSDDWVLPIVLEYSGTKWYAWDKDNTFISQSDTKQNLINEILNKYDIPPKRIMIKSETPLKQS